MRISHFAFGVVDEVSALFAMLHLSASAALFNTRRTLSPSWPSVRGVEPSRTQSRKCWHSRRSGSSWMSEIGCGSARLGTIAANDPQDRLRALGYGDGRHGFTFALPASITVMFDRDLNLLVYNRRFLDIYRFSPADVRPGMSLMEMARPTIDRSPAYRVCQTS